MLIQLIIFITSAGPGGALLYKISTNMAAEYRVVRNHWP
jgi:hypothetical protein